MEGKRSSETRRKKVLDNAEARLRFIKEGIPWRNIDVPNHEPTQPDGNLSCSGQFSNPEDALSLGNTTNAETQNPAINRDSNIEPVQNRIPHDDSEFTKFDSKSEKLESSSGKFIKQEAQVGIPDINKSENATSRMNPSSSTTSNLTGQSSSDILSQKLESSLDNFINQESNMSIAETNTTDNSQDIFPDNSQDIFPDNSQDIFPDNSQDIFREHFLRSNITPENSAILDNKSSKSINVKTKPSNSEASISNIGLRPGYPENLLNNTENVLKDRFQNLKTLLNQSNIEREEQKRRTNQLNYKIWISCFIMLCLGVFARLSYALGISWMFKEVMLLPFLTAAVPRMLPLVRGRPPPSGAMFQMLLMAGIKVHIIRKIFTFITVLRMFLQLFSIYLIAFVFTHQIVELFA